VSEADEPTLAYDASEQPTILLARPDPEPRGWRREDRIALGLLKFGLVAGFLVLEAILLIAVAEIMGVR
jgi:hypothetical protein